MENIFRYRVRVSTKSVSSLKLTDIREIVMEKSRVARLESFKDLVLDELPPMKDDEPTRRVDSVGYYEVGHQFKGKKHKLDNDEDLAVMHAMHEPSNPGTRRSTIFMWMDVKLVDKVGISSSKTSGRHSHSTSSKSAAANAALLCIISFRFCMNSGRLMAAKVIPRSNYKCGRSW